MSPVRIAAGAFDDAMPVRDLLLSPGHAVFVDGVLVPARHLVNGRSIRQESVDRVAYWHVELDRHDVVLAEGLPTETYLDTGNRAGFATADVAALHPDFRRSNDAAHPMPCAEMVTGGPRLAAIRERLARRTWPREQRAA